MLLAVMAAALCGPENFKLGDDALDAVVEQAGEMQVAEGVEKRELRRAQPEGGGGHGRLIGGLRTVGQRPRVRLQTRDFSRMRPSVPIRSEVGVASKLAPTLQNFGVGRHSLASGGWWAGACLGGANRQAACGRTAHEKTQPGGTPADVHPQASLSFARRRPGCGDAGRRGARAHGLPLSIMPPVAPHLRMRARGTAHQILRYFWGGILKR